MRGDNFTTGRAAKILGVSTNTIVKWADSGELPFFYMPGTKMRRIRNFELVKFVRAHNMVEQLPTESKKELGITDS